MAISILGLPAQWRAPGVYVGNIPAGGGATVGLQPTMLLGQMLASGTAVANVPVQVFAQSDVNTLFGSGSMLAQMFYAYRANDPAGAVWACPLADNGAGTAASNTWTLTGNATAAGTNVLYVNNQPVYGAVNVGDTPTVQAATMAAALTLWAANPNVPAGFSASATSGVLTVTSAHLGVCVGDLQLKANKGGAANGEWTPAGVSVAIGAGTAGTADPVLTNAVTNITAVPFSTLVCPYTSSTANNQIVSLLSDVTGRWSPTQQMYGIAFNAVRGTLGALTTYGASVASGKHVTTLGILDSQTPVYVAAAAFAGLAATTTRSNPALPIVGALQGIDSPSVTQRLRRVDENTLLYSGISALRVNNSGSPTLSRAVQNYTTDTNYLNIETDYMVAYVDAYIRSDLESKFAQYTLLADGNPVAQGSGATTPSLVLAHVWSLYLDLAAAGIVQNPKQFISASYVESNIAQGVVSLFLPVQTAGLLRVIRILNSFS